MPFSKDVIEALLSSIEAASGLTRPNLSGNLLIVYSTMTEAPARLLYTSALAAGVSVTLADATEASVLIMPYRDFDHVIIYVAEPRDSRAVRAAEEAILMGYSAAVVGPPLHEALEMRLKRYDSLTRVLITSRTPIMTMSVASVLWAIKGSESRWRRLTAEISDFRTAPEWIMKNYSKQANEVAAARSVDVYYTPSVKAGGIYMSELSDKCHPNPLEKARPTGAELLLVLASSAEEQDYNDIILKLSAPGLHIARVTINTDPITAGLYSMMFASLALDAVT